MVARVLYVEVNEDGTVGGSHRALFDLVRRLDRSRFWPVVAFYQANPYAEVLRALGVEVWVLDELRKIELRNLRRGSRVARSFGYAAAIVRRWRLLREEQIDLVHLANTPFVGLDDWLPAARAARVPVASFAMGLAPSRVSWLQRVLVRSYDRVLPVSIHTASEMARCGVPSSRMVVTYLGVDPTEILARVTEPRDVVRRRLGFSDADVVGLMIGNLRRWKGQHVVVEALSGLCGLARDRFRLVFVGGTSASDSEYSEILERRARESGVPVMFLGSRTDVPNLLNAADIAVHASIHAEPFGLVVTEAMALGKAVIASRMGGPGEILADGSGRLFDPLNPGELASILGELILSPHERARLGRAAMARVGQFTVDRMVKSVESLYSELIPASRAK